MIVWVLLFGTNNNNGQSVQIYVIDDAMVILDGDFNMSVWLVTITWHLLVLSTLWILPTLFAVVKFT